MLRKIWTLLLWGLVFYPLLSAKFCSKRYVNGKWITQGDCGGQEKKSAIQKELQRMSAIQKELQLREAIEKMKKRIVDKKWVIFQRRKYGNVDFNRGWDDYVNGFGNPDGDFWLGLEALHQISKERNTELKIKMISRNGIYWVVKYSDFSIGPGSDKYRLHVSSGYSGRSGNSTEEGDGLFSINNQQFSTKDADNDPHPFSNCASRFEGGWWYNRCGTSNLNANFNSNTAGQMGLWWWSASHLRFSEMMLRRRF